MRYTLTLTLEALTTADDAILRRVLLDAYAMLGDRASVPLPWPLETAFQQGYDATGTPDDDGHAYVVTVRAEVTR